MMTITIASVPDREKLVAELWYNQELWGEISQETGELILGRVVKQRKRGI